MKILFYYYRGGGGGLSNILLLLRALARRHPEDSIEIVTASPEAFASLQTVGNVNIRPLRLTGLAEIDRFLAGAIVLPRLVREKLVDVIWSINLGPYVRTPAPSVLSVHNPFQVYPWEVSRLHPSARWRVAVLRWFFRRSLGLSDAAIVQTPIMRNRLRQIQGVPDDICVAPKAVEGENDVQFEALPPTLQAALDGGLGRSAFTFLYAASWIPHKNHSVLLKAFSMLARRNCRARLVLTVRPQDVGSADWSDGQDLLDAGYVVPVGAVRKAHLKNLYAASDACLMPSVLESLSSAHLEAMQWGRPQIVSDLPYAHDLCGDAALYASPADPQTWVDQIETLIGSPSIQSELAGAGHARMSGYPRSWDEVSETVHGFLDSVRRRIIAEPEPGALQLRRLDRRS